MTAINVIRHPDAVYILTDGAAFGERGRPSSLVAKVFPLPHLNAVVSVRGPFPLLVIMASAISTIARVQCYDALKERVVEIARLAVSRFKPILVTADDRAGDFDLVIAGWSERAGPDSYGMFSHSQHGLAPWRVHQFGDMSISPHTPQVQELLYSYPEGMTAKDFIPEVDGLALLNLQRSTREGEQMMGGFAQLTKVTCDRIETRVLERWALSAEADPRFDFGIIGV